MVIGGGIGGLSVALALRHGAIPVTIFERQDQLREEARAAWVGREGAQHDEGGRDGQRQRHARGGEQQQRCEGKVAVRVEQLDELRRVERHAPDPSSCSGHVQPLQARMRTPARRRRRTALGISLQSWEETKVFSVKVVSTDQVKHSPLAQLSALVAMATESW